MRTADVSRIVCVEGRTGTATEMNEDRVATACGLYMGYGFGSVSAPVVLEVAAACSGGMLSDTLDP